MLICNTAIYFPHQNECTHDFKWNMWINTKFRGTNFSFQIFLHCIFIFGKFPFSFLFLINSVFYYFIVFNTLDIIKTEKKKAKFKVLLYWKKLQISSSSSRADSTNFLDSLSLSIHSCHPLLPTGLQNNLLCVHRDDVNKLLLVSQHWHVHV